MAARDGSTMELSIEVGLSSSEDEGEPPAPPQPPLMVVQVPPPARARELKDRSRRMPGRMTGSPPPTPSPTRGYEPELLEDSLSRRV